MIIIKGDSVWWFDGMIATNIMTLPHGFDPFDNDINKMISAVSIDWIERKRVRKFNKKRLDQRRIIKIITIRKRKAK
jgi:hypothetical protein